MDHGEGIVIKEDFHEVVKKLAEKFHASEHKVKDAKGNVHAIASCVESKVRFPSSLLTPILV
jgi:hypothetical protein